MFYNLLIVPRTISNMYNQVTWANIMCKSPATYQVRHVVLRATWFKGTAQLLSLTEFNSHLFKLFILLAFIELLSSFILLAEPLNRWRRGGNQSTHKKTLATSFRKFHILKPEDTSNKRDSNPHNSIGGRLGKQTGCYTTPHPVFQVFIIQMIQQYNIT